MSSDMGAAISSVAGCAVGGGPEAVGIEAGVVAREQGRQCVLDVVGVGCCEDSGDSCVVAMLEHWVVGHGMLSNRA